jgi:hypothetical protein
VIVDVIIADKVEMKMEKLFVLVSRVAPVE